MAFKKVRAATLTALVAVAAFIIFCPKNESSGRDATKQSVLESIASAPPEHEGQTQQTAVEAPAVEPETQQAPPKIRGTFLNTNVDDPGGVFHTQIVENLPESEIVGAPQSVAHLFEGNCETRHYHLRGSIFFAGPNCTGMMLPGGTPPEDFERKLVPNSPLEKAFDMVCNNRSSYTTPQAPAPGAAQTDSQAKDASPNAPESAITMDLNVTGNDQKLILNVKTNLLPKTILTAVLVRPTNQGGDSYEEEATAAVLTNHVVQFGPFPKAGGRLSPGIYKVTATTTMDQPEEFRQFFGVHGEGLTGPLVTVIPGTPATSLRFVSQTFQFKID